MKSILFIQLFLIEFVISQIIQQEDVAILSSTTTTIDRSTKTELSDKTNEKDPCAAIELIFRNVTEPGEAPACRCLPDSLGILHESHAYDLEYSNEISDKSRIWIGCTRKNMPAVYRLLKALKTETYISEMWIWNSLINILPNDMFANIRPRTLIIENSGLSVFRKGVFSNIGKDLRSLSLKSNILKSIERKTFSDLDKLRSLDLSGNKISELRKGHFDNLRLLEKFQLSDNQIYSIEDGTFESLTNLHTLTLQGNRITIITKDMFRGLTNLEVLSLNGNNISYIERGAFSHLKKLRMLDLGFNKLSELELRSLGNLQQLYLHDNSFVELNRLLLQDLPKLTLLNVDRNQIARIGDNDFSMLAHSTNDGNNKKKSQLRSLSLTGNNISEIGCRAFENMPKLVVLSLQNNQITTLSCLPSQESILVQSVLRGLLNLHSLFLSENHIESLDDGDVNILTKLKELVLDHNKITKIGRNALKGLNLSKLFLNNNWFYYLPEGIFDSWDIKQIKAVDIAENPRECICDREWVDNWLRKLGPANVRADSLGCLATCGDDKTLNDSIKSNDKFEGHSFWITVIAIVLASVALIFLVAASYIYMQSNCYPGNTGFLLRNLPSDMIRLIPSQESLLSFPNPVATLGNASGGSELLLKPASPQQTISSISMNIEPEKSCQNKKGFIADEVIPTMLNSNKVDKKRVRFDGI